MHMCEWSLLIQCYHSLVQYYHISGKTDETLNVVVSKKVNKLFI